MPANPQLRLIEANPNWSKSHLVSKNLIFAAFASTKMLMDHTIQKNSCTLFLRDSPCKTGRNLFDQPCYQVSQFKIGRTNRDRAIKLIFVVISGNIAEEWGTWNSLLVGKYWLRGNLCIAFNRLNLVWFHPPWLHELHRVAWELCTSHFSKLKSKLHEISPSFHLTNSGPPRPDTLWEGEGARPPESDGPVASRALTESSGGLRIGWTPEDLWQ